MRLFFEEADQLEDGVWRVRISPGETSVFNEADNRHGAWTIVAIDEVPTYDAASRQLSFEPHTARLLNLGDSEQALILGRIRERNDQVAAATEGLHRVRSGDRRFLQDLTAATREIGERFLGELRKRIPGELEYRERSGRFIETPDNFWTVRIQPRDRSLRVTVRGNPEEFRAPPPIELRRDMAGYSAFKVQSVDQVGAALDIILQANERRRR